MQYRLRTLLIVLALGPPILAAVWPTVKETLWPPKPTLPPLTSGVSIQGNIINIAPPATYVPERPYTLELRLPKDPPKDDPT